jgi:hypothetical protein
MQFKIAVTISKVKNSFTIVFSVCNNLEKQGCGRKKIFFFTQWIFPFLGFTPKNGVFGLFLGQVSPDKKIDIYYGSARRALSNGGSIVKQIYTLRILDFGRGLTGRRVIHKKKPKKNFFSIYF